MIALKESIELFLTCGTLSSGRADGAWGVVNVASKSASIWIWNSFGRRVMFSRKHRLQLVLSGSAPRFRLDMAFDELIKYFQTAQLTALVV